MRHRCVLLGLRLGLGVLAAPGLAAAADGKLMDLSLEELSEFKITSVAKRAAPLGQSAAAVYVITGEEMRRSGYRNVAEALRMVPGVNVARSGSHSWAIGARGFNTGLSNKLLVLIDGRSVYSPLFSGVFWEVRDVPVEDIDRIEVIRGPGATLWGANAVNGVINIITRRASEAAGWTLRAGGGSEERGFGLIRHGGSLGETADYRITGSGFQRDDQYNRSGLDDEWWLTRVHGRGDWAPSDRDQVMLTTEVYGGQLEQQRIRATVADPLAPPDQQAGERIGASGLGRWRHELEGGSDVTGQLWYEYSDYDFGSLRERRHTVDLDLQHHFGFWERHEVVWGGAYRFSQDEVSERGNTTLDPRRRGIHLVTGFVQDQITLVPDHVDLTLGSKFEYNEFTGFEAQPSGRLSIAPDHRNTLWGAVSRAVRTPTRLEDDADLFLAVVPAGAPFGDPTRPTLFVLRGSSRFHAEEVAAYELGYRVRPHESLSFDVAAFYNEYDDLLTAEFFPTVDVPASGGQPEYVLAPLVVDNRLEGHSKGVELAAWWQVRPWWRLHASYSYLKIHLRREDGVPDPIFEPQEESSPEHQVFARTSFDLPHDLELDGIVRYVDRLSALDIDSYVEVDVRLGWRFRPGWEIAVVGHNLLAPHHGEAAGGSRPQRGVYGQLVWRWDD